jgi:6,7-dimethyl-8-ribityllumazine synthase
LSERTPGSDGALNARGLRIGIVAARFNDFIVERLVSGAIDELVSYGAEAADIETIHVPGAFEIPVTLQKMAKSRRYDALIALGCVIRGATPHFDYVAGEASRGVARVCLEQEIAVGFGVLTVDTLEQAIERAGSKAGNKGADAARVAVQMVAVLRQLEH